LGHPVFIYSFFKYVFYVFNIHIYLFSSTELGDDETLVDKVGVLLGGEGVIEEAGEGHGAIIPSV
jgi:hypothetical protein